METDLLKARESDISGREEEMGRKKGKFTNNGKEINEQMSRNSRKKELRKSL